MSADKELIERLLDARTRLGLPRLERLLTEAAARLEALQPSPETSLQNMQTRGAPRREEVARIIWFVHGDDMRLEDATSSTNDAHWNSWKNENAAVPAFNAADAILALFSSSPTVEGCIEDIKAGLCCPRAQGCEQNDGEFCLVRQAFARAGLIADPHDAPLPAPTTEGK